MLNSSIAYHKNPPPITLALTEEDRAKVALTGATPADIERIQSDDEDEDIEDGMPGGGLDEREDEGEQ